MNRTLLRAQALYGTMGKSEKKVADFLLLHAGEVLPYSIRELAAASDSSEATVVRFSRRLGFAGYRDLKLALAGESEKKVITPYIAPEDDCYAIFEKICNDAYLSLERTKKTLSAEKMTAASDAIAKARKVVLIGLGSSASVAMDAANKLLRAGCNSFAYSDTHMQAVAVSRMGTGDVLVGVSQSGASKDIVDAMRVARERGVYTVAVTSAEKSPITRQSDCTLLTDTEEVRHFSQGFASHLSRLLVLDALCYRVAQQNETEDGDEAEITLLSKRISDEKE